MTIAVNENCHYDDIEWSAAQSRLTRLLRILLSFVSFLKEEFLEFRRLEHFIHGVLTIC